jgi:hypothetical protein
MKQLLVAFTLTLLVPGAAHAFDKNHHPDRRADERTAGAPTIAILHPSDEIDPYVVDTLRKELRARGLDAFDTSLAIDDAFRDAPVADYYVEIAGGESRTTDYGGIDIGGRDGEVSLALLVSRFGTEIRVYDAATMDVVARQSVTKRSRVVLPTAIGLGGLYAYIGAPLLQRAQYRGLARAVSRDAASFVTATVNGR